MAETLGSSPPREDLNLLSLPEEIITSILYNADVETFASLVLSCRAIRRISESAPLYRHQLTHEFIPTAIDRPTIGNESLHELKHRLAKITRRGLFPAYLQPSKVIINLISSSTSLSAVMPGLQGLDFAFSLNGSWTVAWSSSRIYIFNTGGQDVTLHRHLKVQRRPTGVAITNDASHLVVTSSDRLHVYDISAPEPFLVKAGLLENEPHALAMTPAGEVIATAFSTGIEIVSLTPADSDIRRRVVKCDRVHELAFSADGLTLLGSNIKPNQVANTVILSAPCYSDENQELSPSELIAHMWTSQIIFPSCSRDASHAVLLPNTQDTDISWVFVFDREIEKFRAIRTDDLRYGPTYFTGPDMPPAKSDHARPERMHPCSTPAPNHDGKLVASGMFGHEVWIHSLPSELGEARQVQAEHSSFNSSYPSVTHDPFPTPNLFDTASGFPSWQTLVHKPRNSFISAKFLTSISGIRCMHWVNISKMTSNANYTERLLIAADGEDLEGENLELADFSPPKSGRIFVFDFGPSASIQNTREVTLDLDLVDLQELAEAPFDLDVQVDLVRRRTLGKQSRPVADNTSILESTSATRPTNFLSLTASPDEKQSTSAACNKMPDGVQLTSISEGETPSFTDTLEDPYSHNQPRSRSSLRRSATAVIANRNRNVQRTMTLGRVEYRRSQDDRMLLNESEDDRWISPPPPYQSRPVLSPIDQQQDTNRDHSSSSQDLTIPPSNLIQQGVGRPRQYSAPELTIALDNSVDEHWQSPTPEPVSPVTMTSPSHDEGHESNEAPFTTKIRPISQRVPISEYVSRFTSNLRLNPPMSNNRRSSEPLVRPASFHASLSGLRSMKDVNTMRWINSTDLTGHESTVAHRDSTVSLGDLSNTYTMPSATQLATLRSRSRQRPFPVEAHEYHNADTRSLGGRTPAPPPGALGAAGSRTSFSGPKVSSSISPNREQTTHARSRRPGLQRLDTIHSISSSALSRTLSRSLSRRRRHLDSRASNASGVSSEPHTRHYQGQLVTPIASPALKLDRVPITPIEAEAKPMAKQKTWLVRGRQSISFGDAVEPKPDRPQSRAVNNDSHSGSKSKAKCIVM